MDKLNWKNISLKTFCEIQSILKDETLDNEEQIILLMQILYGVDILKQPISTTKNLINNIYELLSTDIKESILHDKYIINGTEYRFDKDLSKVSTLQYIDCTGYIQDDNSVYNYNKLLSVFLIPVGHEYNDGSYDLDKVQNDIDNYLSIIDAISIATFFLKFWRRYIKLSQKSLMWEILKMKKITWKEKKKLLREIIQGGDFFHFF